MADKTGIEWTDATWNPVTGCGKVSQGCKNCYAERVFPRAYGKDRKFTDVVCHYDRLNIPLKWTKPRKIFVNSMSDLFHEDVSDDFIRAVWKAMADAKQHIFQVLTKRPERMEKLLNIFRETTWREGEKILPNVWLGVSVEDQKTANERIPVLMDTPASVRFVSAEPLLGPIDLKLSSRVIHILEKVPYHPGFAHTETKPLLDQIIVGGESGPKARPMHPEWVLDIRDQCQEAETAFHFKQWGEWSPYYGGIPVKAESKMVYNDTRCMKMWKIGKKEAGRILDGRTWDEYPSIKRLREIDGK